MAEFSGGVFFGRLLAFDQSGTHTPANVFNHRYLPVIVGLHRGEYNGAGVIAGTVTVQGAPAERDVRVMDRKSSLIVASGRSGPDGYYRFTNLTPDRDYLVIALDDLPDATYNAVVADRIRPALEP